VSQLLTARRWGRLAVTAGWTWPLFPVVIVILGGLGGLPVDAAGGFIFAVVVCFFCFLV
jgi:hypothetical protein